MDIIESGRMLSIRVNRLNEITVDILKETNVYTITAQETASNHDTPKENQADSVDAKAVQDNVGKVSDKEASKDNMTDTVADHALNVFIRNCTVNIQRLKPPAPYQIMKPKPGNIVSKKDMSSDKENCDMKVKKNLKMSKLCKVTIKSPKTGKKFNLKKMAKKKSKVIKSGMKKCFRPKAITAYAKVLKKGGMRDAKKTPMKDAKDNLQEVAKKRSLKDGCKVKPLNVITAKTRAKEIAKEKANNNAKSKAEEIKTVNIEEATITDNAIKNSIQPKIILNDINTQAKLDTKEESKEGKKKTTGEIESCTEEETSVQKTVIKEISEARKEKSEVNSELEYCGCKIKRCSVRMKILKEPFAQYLVNVDKSTGRMVKKRKAEQHLLKGKKCSKLQDSYGHKPEEGSDSNIGLQRLQKFQISLYNAFNDGRNHSIPVDKVREAVVADCPLSDDEFLAALKVMMDENKIMVANQTVFLI